jgi:ABC-type sugar transport system substrate-binding protein
MLDPWFAARQNEFGSARGCSMKPWVLVSLLSDHQEYQRLQASEARTAAARGGLDARVVYSESDPTRQIQQISEAVGTPEGTRPAAVVAETAGSVGFERVARAVLQAGVGWVLVSDNPRYLDTLRREYPDRLIASACIHNEEIGRLLGKMALALLPVGGKVLCVEGPIATAATLQRRRGLEDGIRGSRVQIYKTLGSDWTAAGAKRVTEAWLGLAGKSAQKPDLVVSLNDEMAVGVQHAMQAKHPEWGKIRAIGCDGLPDGGQRLVKEGVLAATIVTPASTGPGTELVVRSLRGEKVGPTSAVPVRPFPSIEELTVRG